MIDKNTLSM